MLLLVTTEEFQRYHDLFKETTKHENIRLELLTFTAAISPVHVSDSNYFNWRSEKFQKNVEKLIV